MPTKNFEATKRGKAFWIALGVFLFLFACYTLLSFRSCNYTAEKNDSVIISVVSIMDNGHYVKIDEPERNTLKCVEYKCPIFEVGQHYELEKWCTSYYLPTLNFRGEDEEGKPHDYEYGWIAGHQEDCER